MPRLAIGDGEIAYEESGSGHPLLFVSGLNGTGRSWAPQVPFFSQHYRVITYDQRGTGASDRLQRSFSVDGMAADVIALLDALGLERVGIERATSLNLGASDLGTSAANSLPLSRSSRS